MLRLLSIFIASSLLLNGCSLFNFFGNKTQTPNPTATASNSEMLTIANAKDGLITFGTVNLESPGYLVVYNDNGQGQPGKSAGLTRLLPAGNSAGIAASVSGYEVGKKYIALVHYDKNNDLKFILSEDPPALKNGQLIQASVTAE